MGSVQEHGVNRASATEPEDQNRKAQVHMRSQKESKSVYQTHKKIVCEIMCTCGSDPKQHNEDF